MLAVATSSSNPVVASTIAALAAGAAWIGTFTARHGGLGTVLLHLKRGQACPLLNNNCSSIYLTLHPPREESVSLAGPTGGGRIEAACADGIAQRQRLWRHVTCHAGTIGLAGAWQQAEANARSMKRQQPINGCPGWSPGRLWRAGSNNAGRGRR